MKHTFGRLLNDAAGCASKYKSRWEFSKMLNDLRPLSTASFCKLLFSNVLLVSCCQEEIKPDCLYLLIAQ